MFKGISKEFKEKLERLNKETEFFCFSCYDLELGNYSDEGGRKFYLHSDELKQKLNKIIQEHKQPGENILAPRSIFFNRSPFRSGNLLSGNFANNIDWWFIFPKDSIYQMAKKGVQQKKNGFLVYDGEGIIKYSFILPEDFFGTAMYDENRLLDQLRDKVQKLRDSAVNKIDQAIAETKIDISNLEINYLHILPSDCQCEVEVNPDGTLKNYFLYSHHINSCLGRNETEIKEFKEATLEQIQWGKISFNNYLKSTVSEIETFCENKGVEENSIWHMGDWKEWLRSSSSHQDLQRKKKSLLENIEFCAKINADQLRWQEEADKIREESARQEAYHKAQAETEKQKEKMRREAQSKAERLEKEQEKKRQEKTWKRTQQEQKNTKQQEEEEKLKKQQEENLKKEQEKKQKKRHRDPNSKLTLDEIQEEIKKNLEQDLNRSNLQTSDLPEEFQHWTEKLKNLKSKEEIYLYQDFILDSIAKKVEERKINNQEQPKSSSWLDNLLVWGGIFSLFLFLFFFLKKLTKK